MTERSTPHKVLLSNLLDIGSETPNKYGVRRITEPHAEECWAFLLLAFGEEADIMKVESGYHRMRLRPPRRTRIYKRPSQVCVCQFWSSTLLDGPILDVHNALRPFWVQRFPDDKELARPWWGENLF